MKQYLILWIMSISTWTAYAHAPNEAFFDCFISDGRLLIKAEFPWTIRNVLLAEYPSLKTATSQEEMEAGFLKYLQQHITILAVDQKEIPIEALKAVPNLNGHGHGNVYMLLLAPPYKDIFSIENTCMFEAYPNQKNYHTVALPKQETVEFITTNAIPSYNFVTNEELIVVGIGVGLCLLLGFSVGMWKKNLL